MASLGLYAALVIVLVAVLAACVWYMLYRYNTTLVTITVDLAAPPDKPAMTVACASAHVLSATFTAGGVTTDILPQMRKAFLNSVGGVVSLRPELYDLPTPSGTPPKVGVFSVRYRCEGAAARKALSAPSKEGFYPEPDLRCWKCGRPGGKPHTCHGPQSQFPRPTGSYIPVDLTARNAGGTVVMVPYSTQSRVSLERDAQTPEVATPADPVTNVGKTSMVRRLEDRYRRKEFLGCLSDRDGGEDGPDADGDDANAEDSEGNLRAARRHPDMNKRVVPPAPSLMRGAERESSEGFADGASMARGAAGRRAPHPEVKMCLARDTSGHFLDYHDEFLTDGVFDSDAIGANVVYPGSKITPAFPTDGTVYLGRGAYDPVATVRF